MEEERKKVKKYLCKTYGNEIIKYQGFIYLVDIITRNKEIVPKMIREYEKTAAKHDTYPWIVEGNLKGMLVKLIKSYSVKKFINYNITKIWN